MIRSILLGCLSALVLVAAGGFAATASADDTPSIVGGTNVSTKDYPWLLALYNSKGKFSCAGELIAPEKVLTAGHCTGVSTAVQGRDDVTKGGGTTYRVVKAERNPGFRNLGGPAEIMYGDVGVLTLDRPVRGVKPIGYVSPRDSGIYRGRATIVGWGTNYDGGKIGHLKKATVPLVSNSLCTQAYGSQGFKASQLVCAGNWTKGGVDACSHDSGGPLLIAGRVAGTVSGGESCAQPHKPGTYARLTTFSRWITAHLR
ncbi:serine protease [Amycolatopsis rhizosphaerae]|uniref:Serine protease n=1 Tax=Amycolatopsis rhizosphaerae TaxID=2053003 RepID=A0A558BNQ6_9PSEU|nr:serine protease [Amycolatopsis rhizosphaerae]TVT38151.1 serine protease [Amycolatopsis rhizosphaerae]